MLNQARSLNTYSDQLVRYFGYLVIGLIPLFYLLYEHYLLYSIDLVFFKHLRLVYYYLAIALYLLVQRLVLL